MPRVQQWVEKYSVRVQRYGFELLLHVVPVRDLVLEIAAVTLLSFPKKILLMTTGAFSLYLLIISLNHSNMS